MSDELLGTKFFLPPLRPNLVPRERLLERLDQGLALGHKLTLISAPAGFGKTTLASEWVHNWATAGVGDSRTPRHPAWLSLDEADDNPARFLSYLIAALNGAEAKQIGADALRILHGSQTPSIEQLLISLINDISATPGRIILILDDYHLLEAQRIHEALAFLLKHLPPQLHLVLVTREDPSLPLSRLRARGQLTEVRVADLRFTHDEAAELLNRVVGLNLSGDEIAALEKRTEGWIAGLQLAALSMQEHTDPAGFIQSFTGSHRFVLDYLVEEVLQQQPQSVQRFLLSTSILDRMCGSLCDAVLDHVPPSGQETLAYLERANLFLIPLDDERHWYRYHQLFADFLRQRLQQRAGASSGESEVASLHRRASIWYEEHGLALAAFRHAAAANDMARAARLVEGEGMPLHFRGDVSPVLTWLSSLPATVLNARPSLWVTYASALTMAGRPVNQIEEKLQAAEGALAGSNARSDERTRDLVGQIAATRAMLAVPQNQVETMIDQSRRALAFLHPDNLPLRTAATWTLGHASQLRGDHAAARQAYAEVMAISRASGNVIFEIAATIGLGQIQESEIRLQLASETYRRVLELAGNPPLPVACEAHLGLARLCYEWNDFEAAQEHGQQGLQLARLLENVDTPAGCMVLLARLDLARGDVVGAGAMLANAEQFVREHNFAQGLLEVAAMQALLLLRQGKLAASADLAEKHDLLLSLARVRLAQGDPAAALVLLEQMRRHAQARGRANEQLKGTVLQAVALHAQGETGEAVQLLADALALAEPGGFIRLFVDEGPPMAALLAEAAKRGVAPGYVRRLQAALGMVEANAAVVQPLPEALTERELEVLRLLTTELNGPAIARELTVSLNTMRTHTKNIYSKLGVNSRRAAVRRAEELDLL